MSKMDTLYKQEGIIYFWEESLWQQILLRRYFTTNFFNPNLFLDPGYFIWQKNFQTHLTNCFFFIMF